MLKAIWRWLWPEEAKPARAGREIAYVTPEQLEAAIEKSTRELVFEWNETYEKFEKLHLRLAKRADREAKKQQPPLGVNSHEEEGTVSILRHRRLGSV